MKFKAGDLVFAKVRGYPPWPAYVVGAIAGKVERYDIFFYGTFESGVCKVTDLFPYENSKQKLGVARFPKNKAFNEGLEQIVRNPGLAVMKVKNRVLPRADRASGDVVSRKRSREELESGESFTELKRKKVYRTSKESASAPSIPVEARKDELVVVSRSGRKIKPKRFDDDDVVDASQKFKSEIQADGSGVEGARSQEGSFTKLKDRGSIKVALSEPEPYLTEEEDPVKSDEDDEVESITTYRMTSEQAERVFERSSAAVPTKFLDTVGQKLQELSSNKLELKKQKKSENRESKKSLLRIECRLLELDSMIKNSLQYDFADCEKCISLLEDMSRLDISPLMLKKQPEVVGTIRSIRRYVGNTETWEMTEDEKVSFQRDAAKIRVKANHVYNKFKMLFTVPRQVAFWAGFQEHVDKFKEATKNMHENVVLVLTTDPMCLN